MHQSTSLTVDWLNTCDIIGVVIVMNSQRIVTELPSAGEVSGCRARSFPQCFPCFLFPPTGGVVSSRVEESYLWECKQLGAYSPIVLLNTLLFFCTKTFHLTTLAQHQSLSFVNFTRRSKPCSRAGKVHYLQYQRSSSATPSREDTGSLCTMKLLYLMSLIFKILSFGLSCCF